MALERWNPQPAGKVQRCRANAYRTTADVCKRFGHPYFLLEDAQDEAVMIAKMASKDTRRRKGGVNNINLLV